MARSSSRKKRKPRHGKSRPHAAEAEPRRAPAREGDAGAPTAGRRGSSEPNAVEQAVSTQASPGVRVALAMLALAAVAAAVYTRTAEAWAVVFPEPGRVNLLGIDPYYHLRHTRFAVDHFPHVARWDVGTHYPTGEVTAHPGLFNVAFATLALVVGAGAPSPDSVSRVMAWSPVVLQVLAMGALFALTRRVLGAAAAVFALCVYVAFPGFVLPRTVLGFADHHALEVLLWIGTVWGLCRLLSAGPFPPASDRRALARHVSSHAASVAPAALFLFSWSGAPLALLLCCVALVVTTIVAVASGQRGEGVARAAVALGFGLGGALVVVRATLPDWIMDQPRYWALAAGSFALAGIGALASRALPGLVSWLGASKAAVSIAASAALCGAGALSLLSDEQKEVLFGAKSALIHEHVINAGETLFGTYGVATWVAAPAPLLLVLDAIRRRVRVEQWVAVTVGVLLVALWRRTNDYEYATAWVVAFGAAYVAWWVARAAASVSLGKRAVLGGLLVTTLAVGAPFAGKGPVMSTADKLVLLRPGWRDAMSWLRDATPPPEPNVYTRVTSEAAMTRAFGPESYGVLSAWDYGNFVSVLGERTPIYSHGTSHRVAQWIVSPTEEVSMTRVCPKCKGAQRVRYVVISSETVSEHFMSNVRISGRKPDEFHGVQGVGEIGGFTVQLSNYGDAFADSIAARLYLDRGRNLAHYRAVYETAAEAYTAYENTITVEGTPQGGRVRSDLLRISMVVPGAAQRAELERTTTLPYVVQGNRVIYGGRIDPVVQVYEVVKGAALRGATYPGARVVARVTLTSKTSRRSHDYEQSVVADDGGAFEIVVAHSTDSSAVSDFEVEPSYRLNVQRRGAGEVEVRRQAVSEQAVQRGQRLDLGRLDLPYVEPSPTGEASKVGQSPPSTPQ